MFWKMWNWRNRSVVAGGLEGGKDEQAKHKEFLGPGNFSVGGCSGGYIAILR